ncbi:MAG: hypothetical protein KC422_19560 [Trueperaceae bacterium]|nr:hypothetical protein [Trueperaceae bacterium]
MQRLAPNITAFFFVSLIVLSLIGCLPARSQENVIMASSPAPAKPVLSYSNGCGFAAPAQAPSRISVGGLERSFITHIPNNYNPNQSYPIIFAFHGRTNSNEQVRRYFKLETAMPEAIIVYPSGIKQGGSYTWANPGDSVDDQRDFALFDALLSLFESSYCIDASRVYTVGHSLGAYFANDVACARAGVVRAVASLGGGIQQTSCLGAVSAMIMHQPKDNLVPFSSGLKARDVFIATDATKTVARNVSSPLLQAFACERYDASHELVLWCPHPYTQDYNGTYYPHLWPSKTAQAIAVFFKALPN